MLAPAAPRHRDDLVLVAACLEGDRSRIAEFARLLARAVAPACARHGLGPADAADLRQRLLVRLLVDTPQRPAQLRSYRGRGPLAAWLRICATREILCDRRRRAPRPDELACYADDLRRDDDPEALVLRAERSLRFDAALRSAIARLDPRTRASLHAHIHGGSTRELAERYGVHRVTVTRWVAHARDVLRAGTSTEDCDVEPMLPPDLTAHEHG